MPIKFNIEPYYDDLEQGLNTGLRNTPLAKYYKILFRPGYAVQARELTQLQSLMQAQIARFGKHMFNEGSMVIPGGVVINTRTDYAALVSTDAPNLGLLQGEIVTGSTSGTVGQVITGVNAESDQPAAIYISYTNSGTNTTSKTFLPGETLTFSGGATAVVAAAAVPITGFPDVEPIGLAVTASVNQGVYFTKNTFVFVASQVRVITKYSPYATGRVGLRIIENIVTPAEDPNINDNATGTPNYAAPGAHRYEIIATLAFEEREENTLEDFIVLGMIDAGTVISEVRRSDYAEIEKTLARRTFDESGNYTVRPFKMALKEHQDVYTPGDESKLIAAVEPSKAYVQGYEIETVATTNVSVNKAREYSLFEGASVPIQMGNSIVVSNMEGLPSTDTFANLELKSAVGNTGTTLGLARVRSVVYIGASQYRLFLFDIRMTGANAFESVRSVHTAGTPDFVGDVILVNGKAVIENSTRNTMVFKLPFDRVRTLDSELDDQAPSDFNYVYFANRRFPAQIVSGGSVTFNTVGSGELFEVFDDENWLMTVATGASTGNIINLVPLDGSGDINVNVDNQSVVITNLAAYNGESVVLIAGVKRTLQHKTKSISVHQTVVSNQATVQSGLMSVERADPRRIKGVWMSANFATTPTVGDENVTEYYDLLDGQADSYYGIGSIKIKPNTAFRPTGQLLIQVEYFQHSGSGDFFCVDSYANLQDSDSNPIEYEDFPTFNSRVNGTVELRSCIDFRPRVGDDGQGFTGTGSDLSVCPEAATTMTTDIQYYLNRIDKLALAADGTFGVVEGVSALEPQEPADPKGAMTLFLMYVKAYTEGPEEVGIKIIDNKRYTMRDIGALDRRINTLEYYTSLSLLEAETAQKQIQDSVTGLDRFKNGFVVDSFTSHRLGNVNDNEYRISIDRSSNAVRPAFYENSSRLRYNSIQSSNLVKNGDLVTLPITGEFVASQQTKASGVININPNAIFDWTGKIELTPSTDEWKDTDRRPNVVVNQEGVYDAMLATIDATDAIGTVWNEWQTNWTGVDSSDVETKSALKTKSGSNWKETGRDITTTTTTVTTQLQSRGGTETYTSPSTYTTNLGTRVVEINFTPFMRSRMIKFKATRLKPNTTMYAFFDTSDVSSYVRQITANEYTVWSDTDSITLTGINNETTHPEGATALLTDAAGTLYGEFFIPNNSTDFFSAGTKLFELSDDSQKNALLETTSAKAAYRAQGLIETTENVTISTRVPEIEYREVSGNRTISDTATSSSSRWDQESYTTWSNSSNYSSSSSGSSSSGGYTLDQIQGTVEYSIAQATNNQVSYYSGYSSGGSSSESSYSGGGWSAGTDADYGY